MYPRKENVHSNRGEKVGYHIKYKRWISNQNLTKLEDKYWLYKT